MAKNSHDREDLLREATALLRRVVLSCDWCAEIVVGFRRTDAVSFYFDHDLVLQFNNGGQLRRVFDGESMYVAESGQLNRLERIETGGRIELRSQPIDEGDHAAALQRYDFHLKRLRQLLQDGEYTMVGQVTDRDTDVVDEVRSWLDSRDEITIAQRPNVAG